MTHTRCKILHVLEHLIHPQPIFFLYPLHRPPLFFQYVLPLGHHPLLNHLLHPRLHLLPLLHFCFHPGLQYFILMLQCKFKVRNNQRTMNKIEITWRASIWNCVVVGRGRIAGLELVLLAQIWERVGVEAMSIVLSPIQYRPCFLPPPPTLITISPSRSWVLGSNYGL